MSVPALVCAAGCGTVLHPSATIGGYDRHPACEPGFTPGAPVTAWRCHLCAADGAADGLADALTRIDTHERLAHARLGTRRNRRRPRISTQIAPPESALW